MPSYGVHFWNKAPLIRLLIATITGILVQWHFQLTVFTWWVILISGFFAILSFFFIPFFSRYRWSFFPGIASAVLFFSIGALLAWQKDIRNESTWLGNFYKERDALVVTLDEPLVEKTKSFKSNTTVSYLIRDNKSIPVKGKIIIYFRKETQDSQVAGTPLAQLVYGSRIIFNKPLQEINRNSKQDRIFIISIV